VTGSRVTALGPGGEFDRIRAIWKRLGDRVVCVGDDAAIVTIGAERLAFSCDMAVEERHFRLAWLEPEEIGWRVGASALSDLAAVAAEPHGMLASVGVPPEHAGDFLTRVMDGLGDVAATVGAAVWGGDLVNSERVVIDAMVVGRAARPVSRSDARAGDGLWISGRLGAPHEAVAAWLAGGKPKAVTRARYARPIPRVREALWLAGKGATALIDVSDGLVGDAGHVAAASNVMLRIIAEDVPVHEGVERWESALVGGEEYELLVTLPPAFGHRQASEFTERFGLPLTHIGEVKGGHGALVERNGKPVELPQGFSHF
jgi:thiamine-monophosphate kinase